MLILDTKFAFVQRTFAPNIYMYITPTSLSRLFALLENDNQNTKSKENKTNF